MNRTQHAITLVELIVFIVIIGIAGTLLIPLTDAMRSNGDNSNQILAMQLARARMELILASNHLDGFSSFSDPCLAASPPSSCTLPTGFSIATPTIATGWNGSNEYKQITVTVSGKGHLSLTSLVGNNA